MKKLRKREEERAQVTLHEAQVVLQSFEEKLSALYDFELNARAMRAEKERSVGAGGNSALSFYEEMILLNKRRIEAQSAIIQQTKIQVEDLKQQLILALQARKVIESLIERKVLEFKSYYKKSEQKKHDEISAVRHGITNGK